MIITVYTDASYSDKTLCGGWAAWYKTDAGSGMVEGPLKPGTSVSALDCELAAIANALHALHRDGKFSEGDLVVVVTDCLRAIEMIEGSQTHVATVASILRTIRQAGVAHRFNHVKAHQNGSACRRSWVNNLVDRHAKQCRRVAEQRAGRFTEKPCFTDSVKRPDPVKQREEAAG